MLLLPAFRFEGHDIRLPAPADDTVELCLAMTEPAAAGGKVESILSGDPGLLVFCLQRYSLAQGCPAESFAVLSRWLETNLLATPIDAAAFVAAPELNGLWQRRVRRWRAKQNKKRLRRFLVSLTKLEQGVCGRLLAAILPTGFQQSFPIPAAAVSEPILTAADAYPEGIVGRPLPVRDIWLLAAKMQQMNQCFDSELDRQKMRAIKQLAYGASHEINNPLANIATRAQSLMAEETNPSRRQRLSVVYAQAIRAHEMISDMMLFAHPPELQPECDQPRRVVAMVIAELKQQLDEAAIAVRVHQYPNMTTCELDPAHMAEALKAILQNSIHAIGRQGEIRIQIWRHSEQEWALAVADNGPGIEPQIADQIFDPFFSGREAGRGLGFGLSKVWRIVDLHGGHIAHDPDHHGGARLVMRIPIHQPRSANNTASRIDNVQAA